FPRLGEETPANQTVGRALAGAGFLYGGFSSSPSRVRSQTQRPRAQAPPSPVCAPDPPRRPAPAVRRGPGSRPGDIRYGLAVPNGWAFFSLPLGWGVGDGSVGAARRNLNRPISFLRFLLDARVGEPESEASVLDFNSWRSPS